MNRVLAVHLVSNSRKHKMHKVLIVEDEETILRGLVDNFELEGYEVSSAIDGQIACDVVESVKPDLVILDLMLPIKNGYEVCRYIRKKLPSTFIIMLTAKSDEPSKITGLEMGADDYVTKPFSILELLARSKAFLRRKDEMSTVVSENQNDIFETKDFTLNFKKFTANVRQVDVEFNTKEFQILKYFTQHLGEVVNREDLLENVWGYQPDQMPTTRTVDNHIVKIRQKIELNPSVPQYIQSIRGAGYKFEVNE